MRYTEFSPCVGISGKEVYKIKSNGNFIADFGIFNFSISGSFQQEYLSAEEYQ